MKHAIIFGISCVFLYLLVKFSSKIEERFKDEPVGSRKIDWLIAISIFASAILGIIIFISGIETIKSAIF